MADLRFLPNPSPKGPSAEESSARVGQHDQTGSAVPVEDGPYTLKCICESSGNGRQSIRCLNCNSWLHVGCYYPAGLPEPYNADYWHLCVDCEDHLPLPLPPPRVIDFEYTTLRPPTDQPSIKTSVLPAQWGPAARVDRSLPQIDDLQDHKKIGQYDIPALNPPAPQTPDMSRVSHKSALHDRQRQMCYAADSSQLDDFGNGENSGDVSLTTYHTYKKLDIDPTYKGFEEHVLRLNPAPDGNSKFRKTNALLVARNARALLVRHQSLHRSKIKHDRLADEQSCPNGSLCSKASSDTKLKGTASRQITGNMQADNKQQFLTQEDLSMGYPLPPTLSLPAQFECQFCFRIKKISTPSEWTEHIREDLRMFICGWIICRDTKGFRRVDEWVRHEDECHRHPERWTCNVGECTHTCYLRDNMMKHLVRKHNLPDPTEGAEEEVSGTGRREHPTLLRLTMCHRRLIRSPIKERCRFCGMSFVTWKELTEHLARHQEQMFLPLLRMIDDVPGAAELPSTYEDSLVETAGIPACREPSTNLPTSDVAITHQAYSATIHQSDSGYGTISVGRSFDHQPANKLSIVEKDDAIQRSPSHISMESIIENDEADYVTIFSDSGSLASREDLLVTKLADKLRIDLKIHAMSTDTYKDLEAVLPGIFKDFALEMAQRSNDQFGRDTMLYVYRNNEHLMHSFLQWPTGDADDEDEIEIHRSPKLMEEQVARAETWAWETSAIWDDPNQADAMNVCSPDSDQDEMEINLLEHDYTTYASALDNSSAYQWLLAAIRCEIALTRASRTIGPCCVERSLRGSRTQELADTASPNPVTFL